MACLEQGRVALSGLAARSQGQQHGLDASLRAIIAEMRMSSGWWLNHPSLQRLSRDLAAREFDELAGTPGVTSISVDPLTSSLRIEVAAPAPGCPGKQPRLARAWLDVANALIFADELEARTVGPPANGAQVHGSIVVRAATTALLSGGRVRDALWLATGIALPIGTNTPPAVIDPAARERYVTLRAPAISPVNGAGPQLRLLELRLDHVCRRIGALASNTELATGLQAALDGPTHDASALACEFDSLREADGIADIVVGREALRARTTPINLVDEDGCTRRIGRFAIGLHRDAAVRMRNLDTVVRVGRSRYDHPLVREGRPSNMALVAELARLLAWCDYSAAVRAALAFLRSTPTETAVDIRRWPRLG